MPAPSATTRLLPASLAWLLALWFACRAAVAIAAISAFPSLAGRGVIVPGFEMLADHDPAASGRLAAGFVMDRVFAATDLAQWFLAPVGTAVAGLCWWRLAGARGRGLAAVVAILAATALGLTLVHNLSIGPSMLDSLAEYRRLLSNGDLASALAVRDGFDATHVLADRLYGVRMLAVGLALPLSLLLPGTPAGRGS